MSSKKKAKEVEYYEIIRDKFLELFKEKDINAYLEITANRKFSGELKRRIPSHRDIIFSFLTKAAPDITGFVEGLILPGFIIVDVKSDKIKLDYIYQVKKYADLFDAKFAFLVSLEPIPEEIKRLSKVIPTLLKRPTIYQAFTLVQFDTHNCEFVDWFEKNPFNESIYWK
jgi:hypothetical protein